MENILVTGGSGYIGSHISLLLLLRGSKVIILDNLSNSSYENIKNIKQKIFEEDEKNFKNLTFSKIDLTNKFAIEKLFFEENKKGTPITHVIHLAGLKSIRESIEKPIIYWNINVIGSINLLNVMQNYKCRKFIFSSSAAIYDESFGELLSENSRIKPSSPYGKTKFTIENILQDLYGNKEENWKIVCLRYFNPIGAHKSGLIGDNPKGIPNNIFPLICNTALKIQSKFKIFGNDWETYDGTNIRDYVHVVDLAEAHLASLKYINEKSDKTEFLALNIGTGKGTSILELINTFELCNDVKIPIEFTKKRSGDKSILMSNNTLALQCLDWKPTRNLKDMCLDGWYFKNKNFKDQKY